MGKQIRRVGIESTQSPQTTQGVKKADLASLKALKEKTLAFMREKGIPLLGKGKPPHYSGYVPKDFREVVKAAATMLPQLKKKR